jgi:hypothetical protein
MITNRKIKEHLLSHAPQPTQSETFMSDTIRQIDMLPAPEDELQKSLHRYNLMERLAMRMDIARWLIIGGSGSIAVGYLTFVHLETILTTLTTWLSVL